MKARHSINQGQAARQVSHTRPTGLANRVVVPAATAAGKGSHAFPALAQAGACGGVDVWITVAQAAKILGVARSAIYRLAEAEKSFLVVKRPLPRKILISLRSVTAFSEATRNVEFWSSPALQEALCAKLREIAENKA
jgi:predicted DNA-binding transcriptional regulator AlpA